MMANSSAAFVDVFEWDVVGRSMIFCSHFSADCGGTIVLSGPYNSSREPIRPSAFPLAISKLFRYTFFYLKSFLSALL